VISINVRSTAGFQISQLYMKYNITI